MCNVTVPGLCVRVWVHVACFTLLDLFAYLVSTLLVMHTFMLAVHTCMLACLDYGVASFQGITT